VKVNSLYSRVMRLARIRNETSHENNIQASRANSFETLLFLFPDRVRFGQPTAKGLAWHLRVNSDQAENNLQARNTYDGSIDRLIALPPRLLKQYPTVDYPSVHNNHVRKLISHTPRPYVLMRKKLPSGGI
jgi:hypothetical protein